MYIIYVHILCYLKQNPICCGKFMLHLPWFCHQNNIRYGMWSEEKAKPSIPKLFQDSPVVNHIPMQIYWRILKCQVKHDWASKIVNLWGESILIWKSGNHSYYFSIPEHSSNLKNFFCCSLKGKMNGCVSLQAEFCRNYNLRLLHLSEWNSVLYFKGRGCIILTLASRNIFQKCSLILLFIFKYSFHIWWARNLKFKWLPFPLFLAKSSKSCSSFITKYK